MTHGSGASALPETRPVLICLLGDFRVLKGGTEVPMRGAGKTATLLTLLALGEGHRVSRQALLGALWPDSEESRGSHALSSMLHGLHDTLGDALNGAPPIVHRSGACQLNVDAGVGVDTVHFDGLVCSAEAHLRAGDARAAEAAFASAAEFYRGDMYACDDLRAVVERERLRALHLSLLSRLADQHFDQHRYAQALRYAGRLLAADPCREDAHRLVMRCHVRLGERAQALRQYRTCARILEAEFGAGPEPLTDALFDRIRVAPDSV
ncbi:AfsR/SARP family transcriptional regulator [Modestobacter marinus]|uniref:AfsR/SARP family transcriptional regulator n=1 Tax=Modestobacter marinus TaxID=477641 RepID=UPI001C97B063|nr:bacterial transcriptional activator domain-containing protein [Modestobacter marinus]